VPCFTSGRATSSSTLSNGPACLPASRVARPSVATARGDFGLDTTRKSRRATLKLTPSACATVANSCCLSGGDLDGVLEPLSDGLDLGPLLGELSLKVVDLGLGRGAVDGVGDLFSLAVKRLP
jgi:hypothetical protein